MVKIIYNGGVSKIKKFTYIEYLKYQEYISNIDYFEQVLKEDSTIYQYNKSTVYHRHDKIVREILEDKKEVVSFINKALKLENKREALRENDIEKYVGKFITHTFQYAETDVVYRKKDQDIFFLIEHQSTIDYSMPYRILMYSLEIMKSMIDEKQLKKKSYKLPMIYPIILYTGDKKWNVEKYIETRQQKIPGCEPARFYEYNIIDINEYSENELLKDEMFLSKIMLLEKSTTSQQMIENLRKIMKGNLTEKNIRFLKRILYYVWDKEIGEKETQNLLKELKIKRGGKDMLEELLRKGLQEEAEKILKKEREKAIEVGKEIINGKKKEAEKEAEKKRQEAEKEAEKKRQEAEKEAEKKRQEAEKEAEEKRQEAEREAEKKRQEVEKEIEKKRQEAEEELEEKRQKAKEECRRMIQEAKEEVRKQLQKGTLPMAQ